MHTHTHTCVDAPSMHPYPPCKCSAYDEVVEFRDPITNYNSLAGYLFNIQMLKQVRPATLMRCACLN